MRSFFSDADPTQRDEVTIATPPRRSGRRLRERQLGAFALTLQVGLAAAPLVAIPADTAGGASGDARFAISSSGEFLSPSQVRAAEREELWRETFDLLTADGEDVDTLLGDAQARLDGWHDLRVTRDGSG